MRPLRTATAALTCAALLAGCGGSDQKAAFKKGFGPINDQLLTLGGTMGQALQNVAQTSDAMMASEFSGFATQLQGIRVRVDRLKPPGDLKGATATLSLDLGRLVVDLRKLSHAATVHDTQATREAAQALVHDSQGAGDARQTLARKTGVRVGP